MIDDRASSIIVTDDEEDITFQCITSVTIIQAFWNRPLLRFKLILKSNNKLGKKIYNKIDYFYLPNININCNTVNCWGGGLRCK